MKLDLEEQSFLENRTGIQERNDGEASGCGLDDCWNGRWIVELTDWVSDRAATGKG